MIKTILLIVLFTNTTGAVVERSENDIIELQRDKEALELQLKKERIREQINLYH